MKPEVKFISAEMFIQIVDDPEVKTNRIFSQDFDSYCGQFGAVLDLMDVHSVARVGFSTSVLEMVQEMGRCGRGRTNSTSNVTDNVI